MIVGHEILADASARPAALLILLAPLGARAFR
jgi:hypothetical protein